MPTITAGRPDPLGATALPGGTNFAVASAAPAVTLCLLDADGGERRLVLPGRTGDIHHGFVPQAGPGQPYGYRVPGAGGLLLDPYALAHHQGSRHSLVVGTPAAMAPVQQRPLQDSVLYEVHVRGFTAGHPEVPPQLRGTYAGLVHEAALRHLLDLGVTAVELLPVHHSVSEPAVAARGLVNYWGYNTIGFFAPHAAYSAAVRAGRSGGQVEEFRSMVRVLHDAGLEVILDVVYNHTAEGDRRGPTLCHRGLYNRAYYRMDPDDPDEYVNTTGCGNSINSANPLALRMISDSLRHWVTRMGVDGFRFDLAPTLARPNGEFDRNAPLFQMIARDPVLSRVKLIAEPWDIGCPDSYAAGRFPAGWSEWNDSYRDTVRDWWRSRPGLLAQFGARLGGSPDRYPDAGTSVNFVTVHDGFTLADLVSYEDKHNAANGDDNTDGSDHNRSWNCGVEGPTADPQIGALRLRQRRAMLATLFVSAGVPLLLGGDELGRTQLGNNNAYCQDNEISWYDWVQADTGLAVFTATLIALRRRHDVFRSAHGRRWLTPSGTALTARDWADPESRSVAMELDGFVVLFNAGWEPVEFSVPAGRWQFVCDTYDPGRRGRCDSPVAVGARSVVILAAERADDALVDRENLCTAVLSP